MAGYPVVPAGPRIWGLGFRGLGFRFWVGGGGSMTWETVVESPERKDYGALGCPT